MGRENEGGLIDELVAVDTPDRISRTLEDMWDVYIVSDEWAQLERNERQTALTHFNAVKALLKQA